MINNVLIMYFSATKNTEKIAKVIESELLNQNLAVKIIDITSFSSRKNEISFSEYDAVFFGFPVYSSRIPRVCREWLDTLNGKNIKTSLFLTYGGFNKDSAHYFAKEQFDKNNFDLFSSIEVVSAHTYNKSGWKAAINRPNDVDINVVKEYVDKTIYLFNNKVSILKFNKPVVTSTKLDEGEKGRFNLFSQLPSRLDKSCLMCGLCESECPVNAMNYLKGFPNDQCIACFKCITVCKSQVLATNNLSENWVNKINNSKELINNIENLKSKFFI